MKKTIAIASDHAGVELKAALMKALPGWKWLDLGPKNGDRVDYPDYAALVARKIQKEESAFGVLICGSGIGMSIAANKLEGIRAALVDNTSSARLSREHTDANVLCLGSRFPAPEYAAEIVGIWLATSFSNDPRHALRIKKMSDLERKSK